MDYITKGIGKYTLPFLLTLCFSVFTSIQTFAAVHGGGGGHHAPVSPGLLQQSEAQVMAYWTPERMKTAHSADELRPPVKGMFTPKENIKQGPSGFGASAMPQRNQTSQLPNATEAATSLTPKSYSSFPVSTIGKVFFTDARTQKRYWCTGAAINSQNKSVVNTAGHCVVEGSSGNNWYVNWIFCPQYNNGYSPLGCWTARQPVSRSEWTESSSLEDDFGAVVVSPNNYGYLVNAVGGLGWAYGQNSYQNFSAYGYSGESLSLCGSNMPHAHFGGKLSGCYAPPLRKSGSARKLLAPKVRMRRNIVNSYSYDDGSVLSVPCTSSYGASGGPWIVNYSGDRRVNGHYDFGNSYSPYYDSDWFSVFDTAQLV